jgi:signal transduction histidine kinase
VIAGTWTAFAAFYTTQSYYYRRSVGRGVSLLRLLPTEILYVGLWALLTPVILRLARRYPVEQRNWRRRIPLHLAFAFACAVLQRVVNDLVVMGVRARGGEFPWTTFFQTVLGFFDTGMFLYFIVLVIGQALVYYERFRTERAHAARLEADLASARLATLQAQLRPHFLFNTQNANAEQERSDPDTAGRMVTRLSEFLRATLEHRDAKLVSLDRELEVLHTYLDIERVRFGDRLVVLESIAPETRDARLPFLLLQPLVENAIQHGIGSEPGPGELRISAAVEGEMLRLEIGNSGPRLRTGIPAVDGPGPDSGSAPGSGLGLANTRARLRELYGDRQEVTLRYEEAGGATVTVRVPRLGPGSDA